MRRLSRFAGCELTDGVRGDVAAADSGVYLVFTSDLYTQEPLVPGAVSCSS